MIYDVIYDVYNEDMISTYIHINVLPVPGANPVAQRIHAAVPPAPPGGGPAAKFWPLKGTAPPPEMAVVRGNLGNMMGTHSNGICRGTSMIPGLVWLYGDFMEMVRGTNGILPGYTTNTTLKF